jgi:hypothetical protein
MMSKTTITKKLKKKLIKYIEKAEEVEDIGNGCSGRSYKELESLGEMPDIYYELKGIKKPEPPPYEPVDDWRNERVKRMWAKIKRGEKC